MPLFLFIFQAVEVAGGVVEHLFNVLPAHINHQASLVEGQQCLQAGLGQIKMHTLRQVALIDPIKTLAAVDGLAVSPIDGIVRGPHYVVRTCHFNQVSNAGRVCDSAHIVVQIGDAPGLLQRLQIRPSGKRPGAMGQDQLGIGILGGLFNKIIEITQDKPFSGENCTKRAREFEQKKKFKE